jgi:FkbM family methyltransferase
MSEFQRWFSDRGDDTHRLNYDLSEDSVVFDVGGYKGDFAAKLYQKHKCNIYIFEPVKEFYDSIVDRFHAIDKIVVCQYGLSSNTSHQEISLLGDSTSTHRSGGNIQTIALREIGSVMEELEIKEVDLIKINIEGEEFPLLFHCLQNNLTARMKNIQVQFHEFVEHAHVQRNAIRDQLTRTHDITYDYTFVWENWKQKEES